ncbi:MAG TPA: BolA family protein [Steroidobacteraceae bacterium]|nr:BolA family protein [Steroidobacteraceae bacterium]
MTTAPQTTRSERIAERLRHALQPVELEIVDDSHLHAGHAGAADGRGHFSVRVVAERFAGLTVVRRHRLVYEAVGDLMTTDIHALSIRALAPDEVAAR